MPIKTKIVNGLKHFEHEDENEDKVKLGVDSNVFIELFESKITLEEYKRLGYAIYAHQKCFEELSKYLKNLNPNKDNHEIKKEVDEFMLKNDIYFACEEVDQKERKKFENKCKSRGIDCHYPDSEILLSYKNEDIEVICSNDKGFKESAQHINMDALGFKINKENKKWK
jgi:rRNA-processing protein FCF1